MKLYPVILIMTLLVGCASGRVMKLYDEPIETPRVIALDAPRVPWVLEIQNRLKQQGFRVLRWSSRTKVQEQTSSTRTETYNEAEARYVLVIDGFAPYNWQHRCFGGGYKFDYISADLVDTLTNETLLNVNGSGYSEGCFPLSGSIFGDIADAVTSQWN